MRVSILTISTSGFRGERNDTSGDAIVSWAASRGYVVTERRLVADDVNEIARALIGWCDGDAADLVLTTGGTGLSPTDVTPEAMAAVIEREAPGLSEWLRMSAAPKFPRAVLSRGRSGVRHRTLVVNLPGSSGGVKDGLAALDAVVEHAVKVMRSESALHDE
ncbi:MAG: MogA/MoaB family molybdenum cofactor biosynthesis protein [Gemmatimonadaceae bacterium]